MRKFLAVTTVLVAAATAFAVYAQEPKAEQKKEGQAKEQRKEEQGKEQGRRLTLNIDGVECGGCARVLTATLTECKLKLAGDLAPNKDGPAQVVVTCEGECDLGACASKVNEAKTPHRETRQPSLSVILFSKLDERSSQEALTACRKIKGVDGGGCKANAATGEIEVKIAGGQKVTPQQISQAFREAGIEVQLAKGRPAASNN